MKRLALEIFIIAILMLVGCNNVETNRQLDSSSNPTSSSISSPTNYVKTYEDETQKVIQYGKLLINFDDYHVVSDTLSNNNETFKCEIDKGIVRPKTNMTIKIQAIKSLDFLNKESIISYLSDMSPNYTAIRIYNNVIDDSEIISLYSVTGGSLTNYVVCYRDASYLVESDYSILDVFLFKNAPKVNYAVYKQKIECANSFIAYVNETISYNENEFEKAEYDIIQGKDGTKYSAELNYDNKEYLYNFTLKNEEGENLLTLSTRGEFCDVIKILDVNMDGYVDIQFLEKPGAKNNSYALYVWDDSAKNYVKVKCDGMLSYFEVHDGYLLNWVKEDAYSGIIQKFAWDKNTLVKKSEEPYHAD